MNIGQKLRALRKEKGLKQSEIASLLNISQSAYAKIEGDITRLDVERLFVLCEILKVDIGQFFDLKEKQDHKIPTKEEVSLNNHIYENIKDNYETNLHEIQNNYEARIALLREQISFLRSMVSNST